MCGRKRGTHRVCVNVCARASVANFSQHLSTSNLLMRFPQNFVSTMLRHIYRRWVDDYIFNDQIVLPHSLFIEFLTPFFYYVTLWRDCFLSFYLVMVIALFLQFRSSCILLVGLVADSAISFSSEFMNGFDLPLLSRSLCSTLFVLPVYFLEIQIHALRHRPHNRMKFWWSFVITNEYTFKNDGANLCVET